MDRRTDSTTTDSTTSTPVATRVPIGERPRLVSQWALDQIEIYVMDLVADLLDQGWEPEALVDEVDELALMGPHAGQIVTLALVSHAGYWMNDPTMFDLLDEVDELAAGFHHLVGLTVPGWLNRYARGDDGASGEALDGVADTFEILAELALQWADSTRTHEEGAVWRAWRRHRP